MTMPDARRTSADAAAAMAVGLTLLYMAGAYFWMSRALTLAGAVLAPVILLRALRQRDPEAPAAEFTAVMLQAIVVLGVTVLVVNLIAIEHSYKMYRLANIIAQALMTACWIAWLRTAARRDWLAWVATIFAAVGTVVFATGSHLHFVGPWVGGSASYVPPDPWCFVLDGSCGPVDQISRNAPLMLAPEQIMAGALVLIWLWCGFRPRFVRWLDGGDAE
jgi:hypothetical protein